MSISGTSFIRPIKSSSIPSNVMLFDVIYTSAKSNRSDKVLRPIPILIYYKSWRYRNERKCMVQSGFMQPGEDFWCKLRTFAQSKTLTLTMSCSAYVDYTTQGFWEHLLEGRFESGVKDSERSTYDAEQQKRTWKPYYVTEDSPTILTFRFTNHNGTICAIDPRNLCSSFRPSFDVSDMPYSEDGGLEFTCPEQEQMRAVRRVHRMERFYDNVSDYLRRYNLGSLRPTFSAQAMSILRHSFLSHPLEVHNEPAALQLERESYVGGRCECRKIGVVRERLYQFDFNSFYPFCADRFELPIRLLAYIANPSDKVEINPESGEGVIARVTIETENPDYPVRHDGLVIYPTGKFTTTLAGPELFPAVAQGLVTKIHEICFYEMGAPLKAFYTHWKEARELHSKQTAPEFHNFLKMIGNGLIGKLAQRSKQWITLPDEACDEPFKCWHGRHPETGEWTIYRSFMYEVSYMDVRGESPSSIPAIASYVNSYARALLNCVIQIAGEINVYYYDTDSIWTNEDGRKRLTEMGGVHQTDLGKLKLVAAYSQVEFRGVKHYVADEVIKCAGVPKLRVQIGSDAAELYEVRKINSDLWKTQTPQADLVSSKLGRAGTYRHGVVLPGGSVRPFHLEE